MFKMIPLVPLIPRLQRGGDVDHNNRVVVVSHTSHEANATVLGNGRSAGMTSEVHVEDANHTVQPVPLLPYIREMRIQLLFLVAAFVEADAAARPNGVGGSGSTTFGGTTTTQT